MGFRKADDSTSPRPGKVSALVVSKVMQRLKQGEASVERPEDSVAAGAAPPGDRFDAGSA
jgi:hypothetical protein